MSALQITWFWLIILLLTVYAILDGFDLGVGFWSLFTKKEEVRRTLLNSIGPVWDGNEVWLLTGGGAIFAAFPHAYATIFSGFYLAFMLVIFSLIFRAVSIEFRGKSSSMIWRRTWDTAFAIGSIIPLILFGVAIGNIIKGLPLDANMNYTGNFIGLLSPYALLTGLLTLALFAMHGANYIILKTDGELAIMAKKWSNKAGLLSIATFLTIIITTAAVYPHILKNYNNKPILWIIPMTTLFFLILTSLRRSFLYSALSIAGLMLILGTLLFPNIVPAANDPEWSLNIINASSSPLTLKTMLIIATIGMPFVIGYTIWIYSAFKGKATSTEYY